MLSASAFIGGTSAVGKTSLLYALGNYSYKGKIRGVKLETVNLPSTSYRYIGTLVLKEDISIKLTVKGKGSASIPFYDPPGKWMEQGILNTDDSNTQKLIEVFSCSTHAVILLDIAQSLTEEAEAAIRDYQLQQVIQFLSNLFGAFDPKQTKSVPLQMKKFLFCVTKIDGQNDAINVAINGLNKYMQEEGDPKMDGNINFSQPIFGSSSFRVRDLVQNIFDKLSDDIKNRTSAKKYIDNFKDAINGGNIDISWVKTWLNELMTLKESERKEPERKEEEEFFFTNKEQLVLKDRNKLKKSIDEYLPELSSLINNKCNPANVQYLGISAIGKHHVLGKYPINFDPVVEFLVDGCGLGPRSNRFW